MIKIKGTLWSIYLYSAAVVSNKKWYKIKHILCKKIYILAKYLDIMNNLRELFEDIKTIDCMAINILDFEDSES